MEKANNYLHQSLSDINNLHQSLSDINKANDIIRQILNELKEHKTENGKEIGVENNSNAIIDNPENRENASNKKGKIHSSGDNTGNFTKKLNN